jgi:tRNA(His) guanylyltransferase
MTTTTTEKTARPPSLEEQFQELERLEDQRIPSAQGFVIRLDGRGFSKLTQQLDKPFDADFNRAMKAAAASLFVDFNPLLIHTGSDEISAYFPAQKGETGEHPFNGRIQKILSVVAGVVSTAFNQVTSGEEFEAKLTDRAVFDARVVKVTPELAAAYFVWREQNTKRNSVQMACRTVRSHKAMNGLNQTQQFLALEESGIDWNNYDRMNKRGILLQKQSNQLRLTAQDISQLPERHDLRVAASSEGGSVVIVRNEVVELDLPPLASIANLYECLFEKASPELKDDK